MRTDRSTSEPESRRPPATGLWFAAGLAALVQVIAALNQPPASLLPDLQVQLESVRWMLEGGSLYDLAAPNGAPFSHPPFAGLAFAGLAPLADQTVRLLWTALSVLAVLVIARMARRGDGYRSLAPGTVAFVALVLLLSAPVASNLRAGAVSVLMVLVVLFDCVAAVRDRFRGIATGLAAAVYLMPLMFVPYWWFAGRRRTALTALGTFAAATALGWAILPRDSVRYWLGQLWHLSYGHTDGNQSLSGALIRWGVPETARIVLGGVLGAIVVTVALLRAVRAYRNAEPFTAAVIVGAAALVFAPLSSTPDQLWLVLAGLAAVSARSLVNRIWLAAVAIVMILPLTSIGAGIPGGEALGSVRLLLAVAVACVLPFTAVRTPAGTDADPIAPGDGHRHFAG